MIDLSQKALESHPDLVIWPESAVPELNDDTMAAISKFAESNKVWIMLCADTMERQADDSTPIFNSSLLVNPRGEIAAVYHKRRLVIFGEYIPLVRWLPFLRYVTPIGDGFTPGKSPTPFVISSIPATVSVLICFEDVFAQEAREHVDGDTDFLINLTNDGWFGEGAAQWQQAASAVFRAIENGTQLARCGNNGLTCWIDAHGRMRQIFDVDGNIYGEGYMIADIPLFASKPRPLTFYNRFGDIFGWGCCGVTAVLLGIVLRPRNRGLEGV